MDKKMVDFHLHTLISRRNHDAISWYSELNTLLEIRNKKVKAFSFTDHDAFSASFYQKVKNIIKQYNFDLLFYPGVELTIKRLNGDKGHILFIFNDNLDYDSIVNLQDIIYKINSPSGANLDLFIDSIKDRYDFIMIPHVGKCDFVLYEDIKKHINLIKYVESPVDKKELKVFIESSGRDDIVPIMFSDTHHWNKYKGPNVFIDGDINFDTLKTNMKGVINE